MFGVVLRNPLRLRIFRRGKIGGGLEFLSDRLLTHDLVLSLGLGLSSELSLGKVQ